MSQRQRAWMLPFLTRVCGAAVRVYYRFTAEGVAPRSGPVLFVANHPNSIVDAVVATAAAGRPIRFLAKAPLFEEQLMGWLVRAAGAIPVYRRQDDPALMERNATVFEAVHQALAAGDAVGIFPEGLSHSEPSLARLRTGAARISLGAANREEIRFPIVPIGIIHRQKERFRSDTLALVGPPVGWTDLAGRGEDDVEAVRELTRRIEAALREVTVNVERLEDRPMIECAEAIYASELGLEMSGERRVYRLRQATETLTRLRREEPERVERLSDDVESFGWTLDVLGLKPGDLDRTVRLRAAAGWSLKVFGLLVLLGPLAAAGHVVFFVPYQATGWIATRPRVSVERRSSWKLLAGAALYLTWIALISVAAGLLLSTGWGVAALIGLPGLALVTQFVRERWREARAQAHRVRLLRRTGDVRERLLAKRRSLARELDGLRGRP